MINLIGVRFKDIQIGEEFEVYGDIYLNYNSPVLCRCLKISNNQASELLGINFYMDEEDAVYIKN